MAVGTREFRQMPRAVRRFCGQQASGPIEVVDQSVVAISTAGSPPPDSQGIGSEVPAR
jgi:hypothetical protein